MFYREVGQFKTSYAADQAIFPILQDRIGLMRRCCWSPSWRSRWRANEYWLRASSRRS